MITVNVREAKTNLSRLLKQVESGEEIIIARNGKPVARLLPVQKLGRHKPDVFKGKFVLPDSFFDPLPEEELKAWEGDCDCDYCSTHLP